jgi:SAM-dependent methyltransferase
VVDVGCGAGPLTEALVTEGFETTGIDSSAELLAIARAVVPTARFINASIYEVEIPPCEAIVALGEPLTYHPEGTNAQRRIGGLFQSAASVLPSGGLFIFDIIETGEPSLSRRMWNSGDDWAILVDTMEDPASQTLIRNIETFRKVGEFYRRGREVHRVQLFDTRWLCDELTARGFEVEISQSYGAQPLAPRRRAFFATRQSSF